MLLILRFLLQIYDTVFSLHRRTGKVFVKDNFWQIIFAVKHEIDSQQTMISQKVYSTVIHLESTSFIILALSLVTLKLVRLIKECLNETYSKVRVRKHFADMFPNKNGLKKEMLYRHCFSTFFRICH